MRTSVSPSHDHSAYFYSCCRLSVPDHRRAAPKRQSGGLGGSVRRNGFADDLRSEGFGNGALESDDDFGGLVYADIALPFGNRHAQRREFPKRAADREAPCENGSRETRSAEYARRSIGQCDSGRWLIDHGATESAFRTKGTGGPTGQTGSQPAGPGTTEKVEFQGHAEVAELADALA